MIVIFLIAVFGLAASVVTHFSTFFGINPQRAFPAVWMLHILIFVVWIPTIISSSKAYKKQNRKDFWKVAMANSPGWMKTLTAILFAYAFFNFFFTVLVLNEGGTPSEIDGRKVLQSHGNIKRELTDEEYDQHQAYVIRGFSGHWMIFYAVGMTVLYSKLKGDSENNMQTAGKGVDGFQ
jgi:hypothetical protein